MPDKRPPQKVNEDRNPNRIGKNYDPNTPEYRPKAPSPPPRDD
jgi:hypothetical protein